MIVLLPISYILNTISIYFLKFTFNPQFLGLLTFNSIHMYRVLRIYHNNNYTNFNNFMLNIFGTTTRGINKQVVVLIICRIAK